MFGMGGNLRWLCALLLLFGLVACSQKPPPYVSHYDEAVPGAESAGPTLGPLTAALQGEITQALQATEWPQLDPSLESVVSGSLLPPALAQCTKDTAVADPALCTYGSSTAPVRVVLVGDSVGLGYAAALREIALNSNGRIQVYNLTMGACAFANDMIDRQPLSENCAARKQSAIDVINTSKPNVVIVSNRFSNLRLIGSSEALSPGQWSDSVGQIVDKFRGNTGKVVFIASPAGDAEIGDCFSKRSSTPASCIGKVGTEWNNIARAEQNLAKSIGATWIDSRPWFCTRNMCPAFVGTAPTKHDSVHMAPTYGEKIYPAVEESLRTAGVF